MPGAGRGGWPRIPTSGSRTRTPSASASTASERGEVGYGPSLQDVMSLRTYAGGMRVAVLARAERLTEQAADALLKTLEEPPPGTLIILCAANPEALPATVLSRVQHALDGHGGGSAHRALADVVGDEPRLAQLSAALAGGRPGRALRLASEPGALAAEIAALHAFLSIAGGGMEGALRAASDLTPGAGAEGRERAMMLLAVWSSFVRDAALEASGVTELRLWTDYVAPPRALGRQPRRRAAHRHPRAAAPSFRRDRPVRAAAAHLRDALPRHLRGPRGRRPQLTRP